MYGTKPYASYWDVPWYRQSGKVTAVRRDWVRSVPAPTLVACVVCLTGGVYYEPLGKDGGLAKWSGGNKVAAVIVLLIQGVGIANWAEQYRAGSDPARAVGAGATFTNAPKPSDWSGSNWNNGPRTTARFRSTSRRLEPAGSSGKPTRGRGVDVT